MHFKDSFHPYAMLTILFWSLAYVLTRLSLQHFSVFSLGFLRYFIASCVLAVLVFALRMGLPRLRDLPLFLASAATGFFLYMIAFNQGQALVTSATASVVIATVPVLTALMAGFAYKEKLKPFQWAAIGLEFTGVVVLAAMDSALSLNAGLFWLLPAALLLSLYNVLQRKLTRSYPALQVSTYSIFLGTLMLAIFAPEAAREVATAPPVQFVYLAVLGVGSSAIAYVAWTKAFAKAKQTSHVSNYMFVTPFLASLMGFLLAGEVPDRATLVGGAIILTGLLLFNFGGAFRAAPRPTR